MSILPSYESALWHVAGLVGISSKDLNSCNRETIHRAIKGEKISEKLLTEVRGAMEHALYERLRRDGIAPRGIAGAVLDEIVVYCLRHYKHLRGHLQVPPGKTDHALRILIREVWAPTIHLVFLKYAHAGLGGEFRTPGNWYLPDKIDGRFQLPVSVLLDRWLRTAGLRTAYGVTKSTITRPTEKQAKAWAAEKKKLENWLAGRVTPTFSNLNSLVGDYPEEVAWLDSADSWRARFLLAHVLSKACKSARHLFRHMLGRPITEITAIFTQLSSEVVCDDADGILSDPSSYFATRLWLRELEASGELKRVREAAPERISRSFGPDVSDAKINATRHRDNWAIKPGNHISDHLARLAGAPERAEGPKEQIVRDEQIRTYLLSFAATKLNRMISEETKNAGERAVPRLA